MIRIFDKEELNFNSLGLGSLDDSIAAIVVEEINGRYELEMEYPISGRHFDKIKLRNFILCKPNMYDEAQPFRIYAITKPINGVVTISGEHISYDTMGVTILPTRNEDGTIASFGGTLDEVLTTINNSAVIKNKNYFTLERGVDKKNVEKEDGYKIQKPMNLRSLLGGVEGSLLDEFKGEWSFDKFKIILNNERGKDRGLTIRYGKNMTDLEQELTGSNTFTSIFPFYSKSYSVSKTINSFVYQTVYTRNNVTPLRHDWLSLTDPNYGTNTPLVPLIESSQIIVDGLTKTVTRLVAIEVKTEGDYYGRLFAFRKNSKEHNNLFDVYITQRTITEDTENNTTTETIQQIKMVDGGIITPKFGNIYVVKGVILPDNTISEDTSFLNRKIAWDNNLFVQYTSDGYYIEVFNATEDMPNPFPNEPYIVDGKTYVRPRRPSVVTESEEKYVYLDLKGFVPKEPETSEETGDLPEKVYPFESDEGTMYVSETLKNLDTQKVLTLDLTDELDKIPNMEPTRMTSEMLFDKAEQYLKDNDLTKIKESVKVSFIKLSDSAEYERFKPLEVVTLGDKIDVIYEELGVKTTHRVISTEYNVLTNAYNEIELGDKIGTISDNIVTMGDPVSGLTNDAEFTNKAYVTEFVAENAKITNAYIQNAIIEYLQVSKINISGLLEASAATIDELVTTLLIAEDAKIANLLEAGSIKVRGHISALSGDIGGSKIQNGKLIVSTSISIQGTDDGAQVHFIVDEFGNVQANSLSITGGSITIGENFSVDNAGIMKAKQAEIEGDVKINSGSITIGQNFEVSNDGKMKAKDAIIEGHIAGGSININENFTVDSEGNVIANKITLLEQDVQIEDGKLYAVDANITGLFKTTDMHVDNKITFNHENVNLGWVQINDRVRHYRDVKWSANVGLFDPSRGEVPVFIKITNIESKSPFPSTTIISHSLRINLTYSYIDMHGNIQMGFDSTGIVVSSGKSVGYSTTERVYISTSYLISNVRASISPETRTEVMITGTDNNALGLDADFAPTIDGAFAIGNPNYKWSTIYAASGSINTSDRNQKNTINYNTDVYDELFDLLQVVSYKYNNGQSGRTHLGLIAQDVKESMDILGIDSKDFAAYIKSKKQHAIFMEEEDLTDDDYVYGLRYSEFIPMLIKQIQLLKKQVKELAEKVAALESNEGS